jgi:hypothetical protein
MACDRISPIIMIAGLRGLGLPAAYISGYIRTIPPPGKKGLEGADAMHAWVSLWCGGRSMLGRPRPDQFDDGWQRPYHVGEGPLIAAASGCPRLEFDNPRPFVISAQAIRAVCPPTRDHQHVACRASIRARRDSRHVLAGRSGRAQLNVYRFTLPGRQIGSKRRLKKSPL